MITGKNKLAVEKLFRLSEIAIIDVKDSESTNTFKIMKHPDSYLYKCESNEDKRSFLLLVKRASEDLLTAAKKKNETAVSGKETIEKEKVKESDANENVSRLT